MANPEDRSNTNPAEVRGDIQKGRTGDKIEGFDPAASPMETDSEAGGQALTPEQVAMANSRAEEGLNRKGPGEQQASHNSAMRRFEGSDNSSRTIWLWVAGGVLVLIVAIWMAMD